MKRVFSGTGFIQFVGWKEEDFLDRDRAFNAALKTYYKLHDISNHDMNICIHVKKHEVEGSRRKYSVRTRLNGHGFFFEAKAVNWKFVDAVQDAMHTIEKEAVAKLKRKGRK